MSGSAGELISELNGAARQLAGLGVGALDPGSLGESIVALEATRALLDSASAALIGRFDSLKLAEADGLRTTRSWLVHNTRMSGPTAGRRVRTARALGELPVVAERCRSGGFSFDQADAFAKSLNPRTADAMGTDEEFLAALADEVSVDQLTAELRGWAEMVDTDGVEPDPGHVGRGFSLSQGFDSSWSGNLTLGSADGALLASELERVGEVLRRREAVDVEADPTLRRAHRRNVEQTR